MAHCKACGAEILFIKTQAGKLMPVNPGKIKVTPIQRGGHTYITKNGWTVNGRPFDYNIIYDGYDSVEAYECHFSTCPAAKKFRKRDGNGPKY